MFKIVLLLFIVTLSFSCGKKSEVSTTSNTTNQSSISSSGISSVEIKKCNLSKLNIDSKLGSPETIYEVIDLINSLPKPVNLSCFLQALNRPLKINLTSSNLSIQPATNNINPRAFIFSPTEKLILSINFIGAGSNTIELSYLYSDTQSLKAEITFPIEKNLDYKKQFDQINTGNRTNCSGCHTNETLDKNVTLTQGFVSTALKPDSKSNITVTSFNQQRYLCEFNNDSSERCLRIRSLFENGNLVQTYFPTNTPTYFKSLGF